jgi:hypothetical protein
MNAISGDVVQGNWSGQSTARVKLFWLAQGLRALSVSYAVWVLVRVVQWWTDSEKVIKNMGLYLGRELSALSASPRMMAMALDLVAWLLLLAAVVCCWQSLGVLIREHTFTRPMARMLTWAGWLGALCQVLTLLTRPLQTYLMTAHLTATGQVFKWAFYPHDLLSTMLCGVMLCFAYLIAWAVDIAEENRGFI